MNYFISDTHFGHERILTLKPRPYTNIIEHDEALIEKWNRRVKQDDTVYILGDFTTKGAGFKNNLFQRLNGNKVLVKGNHDHSSLLVGGYVEMLGKGWELVHNPDDSSASTVIHGHIHVGAERVRVVDGRLFVNVNCELWDYTPVSVKQIYGVMERMKK